MSDRCTIQDIFNQFYPSYELSHKLSAVQRKTAYSIMNCKTGAFGVNISVCEECSTVTIPVSYTHLTLPTNREV